MSAHLSPLPATWEWTRLGEVASVIRNGISAKPDAEVGTPVLRISSVRPGRLEVNEVRYLSEDSPSLDQFAIQCGDVLFTRYNGTRELVGVAAVVPNVARRILHPDKLIKVRVPDNLYNSTFVALVANVGASREFLNGRIRTTAGQAGISGGDLRELPLPLPPRAEQNRIVAAIEQHLSDVDAGVAALERILANLKRYRASVLKAACEGRLVPAEAELARKEGRTYEPADVLLKRILKERRARWEADQLAKMKAKGQEPRDEKWKAKYEEPKGPALNQQTPVPIGWSWVRIEQIATRVTVGHVGSMKERYVSDGIPFLRSQNVRENRFDSEGLLFIPRDFHEELAKSQLMPDDVAVVRSGAVGTACVIPDTVPVANCSDLVIIQRPLQIAPKYLAYVLNSVARRHVEAGKVGIALTHFNTASVADLPVAIPPLPEQHRIVTEVDRLLSVADETEQVVRAQLKRAERLRQSILKRAFEGKLVPQDPNDEPASVLLERIRTQSSTDKPALRVKKKARSATAP